MNYRQIVGVHGLSHNQRMVLLCLFVDLLQVNERFLT